MSKIEVNTVDVQCGSTLTLGSSGKTVTLATGASQSGFGRSGSVNWQTTPKTATFTAANGEGYFANTSGGVFTINLPAGSAGAIVAVSDYTRTFATNNLTIAPNGSEKIGGVAETLVLDINGQALTLVYVDATEGWINVQNAEDTETGITAAYVAATGGNATITSGDFKTHIFTGSGTLCVSNAGNTKGANKIDYFVVAGGGSSGHLIGAGGGAGGFRLSNEYSTPAPTMSPLSNPTGVTITTGAIPVTVGGGASFVSGPSATYANRKGSDSVFSTITSTGGGGGGYFTQEPGSPVPKGIGGTGGSGGGSDYNCGTPTPSGTANVGGTGNTPPVSPPQGHAGGGSGTFGGCNYGNGGGGGAGAVGGDGAPASPMGTAGCGGAGSFLADTIIGPTAPSYGTPGPVSSTRYFAGGGGAGGNGPSPGGTGGVGGGGTGATSPNNPPTINGTANTGGGGGGQGGYPSTGPTGGAGGSGIVIIRYKFQ